MSEEFAVDQKARGRRGDKDFDRMLERLEMGAVNTVVSGYNRYGARRIFLYSIHASWDICTNRSENDESFACSRLYFIIVGSIAFQQSSKN